jgi:hypothetical protein
MNMKRLCVFLLLFVFSLSAWTLPVIAADPSAEIEQLKVEIQNLMKRLEDLEKKQKETSTKAVETEKKVAEAEKKAEKAEKKSLKDRIDFSGEARFRIMIDNATTDKGFYGGNQPSKDRRWRDETSFPTRIRLNAHAEVVPDWTDFYARLTINKRWGAFDDTATDPFNRRNSFEASIGHDITARFEQAYMTQKIPYINSTWYIGRLPGLDGPPSRTARSLFPRLFIDSEIDGTLIKWDAPETALDKVNLPWTDTRLWGSASESGKAPTLKTYESKVADKSGIILGYLKYDERKMVNTDEKEVKADANAFLAQAQMKIGRETEVIVDGLTMDNWHMPQTSVASGVSVTDVNTNYYLTGAYVDTQLLGFMLYGAYYYSYFEIPSLKYTPGTGTTQKTYQGGDFPGHMWYVGFNTGDLITPNQQLTVEFAKGSDAWINPFNYRGYRRKGTVLQPAGNYFFDPTGNSTVGFYPFNAQVWDIYYDYYAWRNVRFRLGYIDFLYDKHDENSILGSSKFQHDYWPYCEVNISF